jgi:glycosyltransferase involved in cell wall biosynthesis
MKHHLRIAITADPELAVPPSHYGGIERIIHFLAEGLSRRGHEVVLFAHRDSKVSCELVPYPGAASTSRSDGVRNAATIARRIIGGRFDLIHSFGRLAYLTPLCWHPIRKIMSYQRVITPASIVRARRLFGASIEFTAISRQMIEPVDSLAPWHVVYNGVAIDAYRFCPTVAVDAPLVFLGRIEHLKGVHLAIEAARGAGRRLVIAGNIAPEHQSYFDNCVRPFIDGDRVAYIGPVDDRQKNALLGSAAALLMPVLWDEPFGIVMAEALACGTPVVGYRRGAVPEVVIDGVTGFVVADVQAMIGALHRLGSIDRNACRADAEARFTDRVIVDAYESLYRSCDSMPRSVPASASNTAG